MLATLGENAGIARACFIKQTIGQNSSELSTSRLFGLWEVDRDLGDVQPVGRTQDDPSPRHVFLGAVAIGDNRLQTSAILGRDQRTDDLSHAPSIAHPLAAVNPVIASLH